MIVLLNVLCYKRSQDDLEHVSDINDERQNMESYVKL